MDKKKPVTIALALAAVTIAVYSQVGGFDFINFDDPDYISENLVVQSGLTLKGLEWAFTTGRASNWHPLTWLSLELDCQIFGVNPGAHHLMNLFFHVLSSLLLLTLLYRTTASLWRSAFVAALFALHPLHVESVAWLAERKDVLSTFFWMLTLWAYVYYVSRPGLLRYILVFFSLALGLLAKPMLVTLPLIFLVMDFWPLKRISLDRQGAVSTTGKKKSAEFRGKRASMLRLVKEKLPFVALSIASSIITYVAQQRGGAVAQIQALPLSNRLSNAVVSYAAYLVKMIWPTNLAIFYPYSRNIPVWQTVGATLVVIIAFALAYRAIRRHPYVSVGWLWYFVTLLPVIGIVQVGNQSMADRYTYVPLIGIWIAVAWGLPEILSRWKGKRIGLSIAAGAIVLACCATSWAQLQYWKDSFVLYEHALAVTKDNDLAHNNLGAALFLKGRMKEAIFHYNEAIRIHPDYTDAVNNLGLALAKDDRPNEAIDRFREALKAKPDNFQAHNNLAVTLAVVGRTDEALAHYNESLRLNPDYVDGHINLAGLLSKLGKVPEALAQYSEALRIKPDNPGVHSSMAFLYASQGKYDIAVTHLTEALRLKPKDPDIHNNLGNLLGTQGKNEEALKEFTEAVRLKPDLWNAHFNIGLLLSRQKKYTEAIGHFRDALRINPDDAQSHCSLGQALAAEGMLGEAITHFNEALRLRPDYPEARTELDKALVQQKQSKSSP